MNLAFAYGCLCVHLEQPLQTRFCASYIINNYALIPTRQSVIQCTNQHDVTDDNLPDLSVTPALKKAYLSVSLSLSSCEHWSATSQWKQRPAQHAHNKNGLKEKGSCENKIYVCYKVTMVKITAL